MKLTTENIAAIEDLITRKNSGETNESLTLGLFPDATIQSRRVNICGLFASLRALGVDVVRGTSFAGVSSKEIEEFRAWKRQQNIDTTP
jgi:hypothetical protein